LSEELRRALLTPAVVTGQPPAALAALIARARTGGLLATLAERLAEDGVLGTLPDAARRHFESARLAQYKQLRDLRYEISRLQPVFADLGERLICLKGSAYLLGGLASGQGRLISDIDLLTPAVRIADTEQALLAAGWVAGAQDAYDERYYRRWMHELPPLYHPRRGTVLDLHHTILPPTAAPRVDADLLFEELRELAPGVYGLSAQDMVIHSAAHLFYESEFHSALRDLWDQRCLLLDGERADPAFWPRLSDRARALDLAAPVWLSLRYVARYFAVAVPAEVTAALAPAAAAARSGYWDPLFARIFSIDHPQSRPRGYRLAHQLAYLRGHALRMPPWLLLPHLLRKSLRRLPPAPGERSARAP
jgi:hypothetical protein